MTSVNTMGANQGGLCGVPASSEYGSPAEEVHGVQAALHGLHRLDFFGRILNRQQVRLPLAQAVLGGHRASELNGALRQLGEQGRGAIGIGGVGEQVDVDVRVADVAEDYVAAGELLFEAAAVIGQHLAIVLEQIGRAHVCTPVTFLYL